MTRRAISPRFAINIFLNIYLCRYAPHLRRLGGVSKAGASCRNPERSEGSLSAMKLMSRNILFSWPYGEQCLAVFHRLSVVDQHFYYFAGDVGLDLIHELHGFND